MRDYKPSLVLYFTACTLYMLAVVVKNENLLLLAKPVIVPSIMFYYWQEVKGKVSLEYLTIVLLFFFGDMIVLLEVQNSFIFIVCLFLIAYCIFLKSLCKCMWRFGLKIKQKSHLVVLLVCVFFLIYLLIATLDLLLESETKHIGFLVFYGIILVIIGVVSALNYIVRPIRLTFFMCLASLCFIISDVFYILKSYYYELEILDWFNNLAQVLSYYYVTKYFIIKGLSLK